MKYLPVLTEVEVQYICTVIPRQDTITYFRNNPEDFAKICPGFRANAVTRLDIGNLLFRNRNRGFVSFFIERHISDWISQIQGHVEKCLEEGGSKELAYIRTLPFSFFAENVLLYFKLIEEEHSDDYIAILASATIAIKEATVKQEELQGALKAKEVAIAQLHSEVDSTKINFNNIKNKLLAHSDEIKVLTRTVSDQEKLKQRVQDDEKLIQRLSSKIQQREETIRELKEKLSAIKDSRQQLESQIIINMERERAVKYANQKAALKPLCPKDMDEFKDYLGYNLENIGIPNSSKYASLLKEHLGCVLFQGVPILINRSTGVSLMKCIANSISGMPNVKMLAFKKDLSEQQIDDFLSSDGRIVCLDNFIGNFNETELLPLFDRHRDKIIFLTVAYDRTLYYIPDGFLKYCHYLNLNRIGTLSANVELTEDPSTVEEIESVSPGVVTDSRYSPLLRKILVETGFGPSLIEYKCAFISNERDLCRTLAFDILPYCIDVLQIAPYNTSERFVKYAGDSGRCPHRVLFKEWFAS